MILLIDTSTERGIVAIANQADLVFYCELPFGYQNSTHLFPTIEEGLKAVGLMVSDLSLIVVGVGPGSYTGIRVGAIAAKTLAYASHLPLIGLCSLEGFIPKEEGPFVAMIDAKISGVYLLQGVRSAEGISFVTQPEICALEDLDKKIGKESTLVTPNKSRLEPLITKLYPDHSWHWEERAPDPDYMLQQARRKFQKGEYSMDAHLDLIYLRKTQAEIELAEKQRGQHRQENH